MSRALLLAILAASAARAAPALPPAETQSLDAFAAAHAACRAWSDGCVVCRRPETGSFACSTPGIACTRATLMCQDPKEEPKPAAAPH